ncbi:hypothetical protein Tcan_07658 [Toxocara canis]|uniref:Uncharacterized protein n=1 Tax=Toxocara canis TaxID=6265 RepID=A0A0B2VJ61_TOXCA|nr:hypothetical protein Tcan_07658 [Toxocara canis]
MAKIREECRNDAKGALVEPGQLAPMESGPGSDNFIISLVIAWKRMVVRSYGVRIAEARVVPRKEAEICGFRPHRKSEAYDAASLRSDLSSTGGQSALPRYSQTWGEKNFGLEYRAQADEPIIRPVALLKSFGVLCDMRIRHLNSKLVVTVRCWNSAITDLQLTDIQHC